MSVNRNVLTERQQKASVVDQSNSKKTVVTSKCSFADLGIKSAFWLNGKADCESSLLTSIDYLTKHLQSKCNCVNSTTVRLVVGRNYYQLFQLKLNRFNALIADEEKAKSDEKCEDNSLETDSSENIFSQSNSSKPSKYESCVPHHLVNGRNCDKFVDPLKQAIPFWEDALLSQKLMDSNIVGKLQIGNCLITCCYVFECYGFVKHQYRSAKLLHDIFSHLNDQINFQLYSFYLLMRVYLQSEAISKAKIYLKKAEALLTKLKGKNSPSYEKSLILLAKCEIGLHCGRAEEYASELRDFIDSEYLRKGTLNRYYLRGLALHLASRFPSAEYKFSDNFQEFIEPLQISVCILKRWHRPYFPQSDFKKLNEDLIDVDPISYRFAVYAFTIDAYRLANTFFLNSGMPLELAFAHNAFMKIAQKNCFIVWIMHLLTTAAEIDFLCDKKQSSLIKLNTLAMLFSFSHNVDKIRSLSSDGDAFQFPSHIKFNTFGDFQNESSDSDVSVETPSPLPYSSFTVDECAHFNHIPVWGLRKLFMKSKSNDFDNDNDNELLDDVFVSDVISELTGYDNISTLLFQHELYLHYCIFQAIPNNCRIAKLEILCSKTFTAFRNVYTSAIRDAIDTKSDEVDSKLANVIGTFLLKSSNFLVDAYLQCKQFEKAATHCEKILNKFEFTLTSLEMKTLYAYLVFKFAKSKFFILKQHSLITEYDAATCDDICSRLDSMTLKSTPPRMRKKNSVPKAPNRKNEFKMEELKEYTEALSKVSLNNTKGTKCAKKFAVNKKANDNPSLSREEISNRSAKLFPSGSSSSTDDILCLDAILTAKKTRGSRMKLRSFSKSLEKVEIENKTNKRQSATFEFVDENEEKRVPPQSAGNFANKFNDIKSIDDIEDKVSLLFRLLGNHPPSQLQSDLHFLMFEVKSTRENGRNSSAYHLVEATTAVTLRYRNLIASEKKKKHDVSIHLDPENFKFIADDSTQLETYLNGLPSSWRICQLHAVHENSTIPDLYIGRYQKGKQPLLLKIKGNVIKYTKNFMSELLEIIELSNASIQNKDVQTFWKVRFALDNRFKQLMNSVDETWFGPFKGIFIGQIEDKNYNEMCMALKSQLLEMTEIHVLKDELLLDLLVESFALITREQFCIGLKLIVGCDVSPNCYKECETIFYKYYPLVEKVSIFQNLKTAPVGLIVNKSISLFPFESLPSTLSLKQEIFRIPSLRFLSILYKKFNHSNSLYSKGIDCSNVFYLLNPANNLAKTELYFKEKFQSKNDWDGIIGSAPDAKTLKSALETKDLYIFFGHGAGSIYYGSIPDNLEGASIKCAALVVGCCSGKLLSDGENFEPYGIPLRFLMNGSPCYLGILWEVTDRDIDRFADRFLQQWMPEWNENADNWKSSTICNAVMKAREACKLKYLIGASPVVYGLPISVFKRCV